MVGRMETFGSMLSPNLGQFAGVSFAYASEMTRALALHMPAGRFSKGELVWLAFVAVRALDGVMSRTSCVRRSGAWIEANPLVAWYAGLPAVCH